MLALSDVRFMNSSSTPSVSVVLALYNGSDFIVQQLNSILSQSVPPNEIIIVDDCSTDDSYDLCKNLNTPASIDMRIYRNSHNLGYSATFTRGLSLSTSDVVFICDQDDVWFSHKIEEHINIHHLSQNPVIILNDAIIVDKDLQSLNKTLQDNIRKVCSKLSIFGHGCCISIPQELLPHAL